MILDHAKRLNPQEQQVMDNVNEDNADVSFNGLHLRFAHGSLPLAVYRRQPVVSGHSLSWQDTTGNHAVTELVL